MYTNLIIVFKTRYYKLIIIIISDNRKATQFLIIIRLFVGRLNILHIYPPVRPMRLKSHLIIIKIYYCQ